ncbi:MAG: hypothetical protein O2910_03145 [Proteobacteria bacterium]|nr:hypothetical protein [Pseudomonadota bacterium]
MVLLVGLIYVGIKLPETSQLAADISAKWACQCRYIDGGDDAFCIAEDPVGFGGTDFSFDPESSSVTTDVWGAVSSTATYKPGWGCMVQ